MATDERLTALKKAYADIILNTAKEAATRIMLSERKAQRFQRELQVAKDEALRMLLRLKQMMDSKIAEAEVISLKQQGKIEELEAQLQEAEDIVKDLRDELSEVQSELEWMRKNKLQHLDDNCSSVPRTLPEENRVFSPEFIEVPSTAYQFHYVAPAEPRVLNEFEIQDSQKLCMVEPYKVASYNGCLDVPSTVSVHTKPELYRNGCTQRIRASEGDLLARKPSHDGQISEHKDGKSGLGPEISDKLATVMPCGPEKQEKEKISKNEKEDKLCSNWQPIQSFPVKRKRTDRYRRSRSNSSGNLPEKSDEASDVSCMEAHPSPVRSDVCFGADTSQTCQQLSMDEAKPISLASCAEVSANEQLVADCCSAQNPVKKGKVMQDLISARHKIVSEENSVISVAETGVGDVLLPEFNSSKAYADEEALGQPRGERIIKITFQRKRKKESLSGCTRRTSFEKETSNKQKMDHQIGAVEEEKPNLVTGLCRDSRRLVQVAHQLSMDKLIPEGYMYRSEINL